jgi:hypothetical protein
MTTLTEEEKANVRKVVKRIVEDYGETLRLLEKE